MNAKLSCRFMAGALVLVTSLAWAQDNEPKALEADYPPTPLSTGIQPSVVEHCEAFRALWVERPIPLRSLKGREIITKQKRSTLKVNERKEERLVTEVELKEHKCKKVVPWYSVRSEKVIDPHTGHTCTVSKVVVEEKEVDDIVYYPVEKKTRVTISIPYLEAAEVEVDQKSVLFECKHEFRKDGYPILVPDYVLPVRFFVGPCPHCDHGNH